MDTRPEDLVAFCGRFAEQQQLADWLHAERKKLIEAVERAFE